MKRILLAGVLALGACIPAEPEVVPVIVNGIVTVSAVPYEGAIVGIFRPRVNGLPEAVGGGTTNANGAFSLTAEIDEPRCFQIFVTVEVRDASGATMFQDQRSASECGDNQMAFDF